MMLHGLQVNIHAHAPPEYFIEVIILHYQEYNEEQARHAEQCGLEEKNHLEDVSEQEIE